MSANQTNEKKNRRKRRFTLPFTIFGLTWGIVSFIFLLTETGKEEPASWILYLIFLPALLSIWFFKLVIPIFERIGLSPAKSMWHMFFILFIIYFPSILFGLLLGFIIGITIDGLIAFFKPIGNDRG